MKRFCDGCRALDDRHDDYRCRLGYRIREVKKYVADTYVRQPKPDEECPKPKTWREWSDAEPKQKERVQ